MPSYLPASAGICNATACANAEFGLLSASSAEGTIFTSSFFPGGEF